MWELAILAAIFSTTEPGTYVSRVLGGMGDIVYAIYAFIRAFALNESFASFMEHFRAAVSDELSSFAATVQASPRKALVAFIVTFISYKLLSYVIGQFRKKFLCRKTCKEKPKKSHLHGEDKGGKTYEQLYQRPEPRAHGKDDE